MTRAFRPCTVYLVNKLTTSELLHKLMIEAVRHADIITDLNKYTEFVSFQVAVMDVAKITDFLIWNTSNHALEEPTGN